MNQDNRWSLKAWDSIENILQAIYAHPFLTKLQAGSLEKERFHFYIHQDAFYLSDYGRVLGGIANKLQEVEERAAFMDFARDTIGVEQALHGMYKSELDAFPTPPKSPTCELYTSYLAKTLLFEPIEVSLAAVLPCFWIYKAVGDHLLSQKQQANNPYQDWIDTYGGEDFARSVRLAIEITDHYAKESPYTEKMLAAFRRAAQLEWMFWDSAYRKENWKFGTDA